MLKSLYLQDKLLSGRTDLKLTLFPFHIVAEARIAYVDVPEWQGILGSLEVIQITFPRIIHKPPRLVAPQRSLAGQFVQVAAQLGGLLLRYLDLGHIHRPGGHNPRGWERVCFGAILLCMHRPSKFLLRVAQRMPTPVSIRMTACLLTRRRVGDVVCCESDAGLVCARVWRRGTAGWWCATERSSDTPA